MAEAVAKRIYPKDGQVFLSFPPDEVCYGQDQDGLWWFKHPDIRAGVLSLHDIEEHEDGAITVTPSILQTGPSSSDHSKMITVHGYLTRGVWRDC